FFGTCSDMSGNYLKALPVHTSGDLKMVPVPTVYRMHTINRSVMNHACLLPIFPCGLIRNMKKSPDAFTKTRMSLPMHLPAHGSSLPTATWGRVRATSVRKCQKKN